MKAHSPKEPIDNDTVLSYARGKVGRHVSDLATSGQDGATEPGHGATGVGDSSEPSLLEPAMGKGARSGPRSTRRSTRRSVIAWGMFGLSLVVYVIFLGIPYSTDDILIWISAALLCACISDLERWRRGIIRDWLPLYAVLAFYSLLRGYASHLWFAAHWSPQVRFDEWIGFGIVPTVRLQNALFEGSHPHVWDYAMWGTYMTHFFASFVVAAVLWVKDHDRFRRFVPLFVGLTFAGYLTYVLFPAMPPWMVSANGSISPSARVIPIMWNHVGFHQAAALFEGNTSFDNDVAAMPSLHSAFPLLICLFFWARAKTWSRCVLVGYVIAMAATLVYDGEHFVIDILFGWMYAVVTFVVGSNLLDRWAERRRPGHQLSTSAAGRSDNSPRLPDRT
jgi:PAP2 superfamily